MGLQAAARSDLGLTTGLGGRGMGRRIGQGDAPMIQRTVRIPAEVWEAALIYTDQERTTISDVMRDALIDYVQRHDRRARRAKRSA